MLKQPLKLVCNLLIMFLLVACSPTVVNRTTEGAPTTSPSLITGSRTTEGAPTIAPSPSPQLPTPTTANRTTEGAPTVAPSPTLGNRGTEAAPTIAPSPPATYNLPPTAVPSPSPNPQPLAPIQIAPGGCCQAFKFASDGRLYYYDNPAGANAATYVLAENGQSQKLTNRFGNFSADLSLVAVSDRASSTTTVERVSDGAKLATLQNRASPVIISPDKTKIAYLLRGLNQAGPEEPQFFELWIGNIDGTQLRAVWSLREGANLAWFPDSRHLLLTARDAANQRFGLWTVDTQAAAQTATLIIESKGLTVADLSPDGKTIAYAVTLQAAAQSGVWLAQSDGNNKRKMNWTGGWRWSPGDGNELFYIPARASGETSSTLWSYNVSSGQATRLTDPAIAPFKILTDEWEVAPDSKSFVYRNAVDRSVWRLRFR